MKFYLIVSKGKHQGMPIPISVDLFMFGSDKMCQLRSVKPGVGPKHCAIVTRERKVFIQDLGSGETTLINGELLPPGEQWPLHAGDRIALGPMEFMIQFREKALSQRDLEEWALKCLDKAYEEESEDEDTELSKPTNAALAAASILDKLNAKRGVVRGRLRIGREGGAMVLRFNDVYLVEEAEIALVKKEIHDNVNRANLRVLLDFKNVKRMSTAAAEMVADLHSWLRPWGSTLALCRLQPDLRGVLQTLPALQNIPHFGDKKVALAAKW